ncbi:MAG: type I restriction-modification system subunit M [Hydrogenophaga sp.]|nr:type I restriction-modification system subunit M [Hydrogenophaga sp.]
MKNQEALKQQGDVIWNIANLLRGPYRPPQYRRVMIPLTVLRRLDCVLDASKDEVLSYYKQLLKVGRYNEETIEKMINRKFDLNFHNTSEFTFQKLKGDPDKLAANLNHFIAGFSANARKILEKFKFDEEIDKLDEANRLFDVVKQVAAVNLHPDRISNIEMGYLFEDLVRRFNEQANEEAGDHFTPREVIKLMVKLLFTHDDLVYRDGKLIKIYDPTCGTGGMLSESDKLIADPETGLNPGANLELFGQEYNPESYAICGSDLMIKGEDVKNIVYGNTLGTGKPKEGFTDGDGHPEERFHFMLANPPFGVEWKPEKDHVTKEHDQFGFKGRFGPGLPRINDGALLFLMHMIGKMQPAPADGGEGSRIAVVFNGSPLFTGDAGSGESNILQHRHRHLHLDRHQPQRRQAPGQGAAHQRHRIRPQDEEKPGRQAQAPRRRHRRPDRCTRRIARPHRHPGQAVWRLCAQPAHEPGRHPDQHRPQARPDRVDVCQQGVRQRRLRLPQDHRRKATASQLHG